MKVLLVDADSSNGFPNLALMKLSAYYKRQGFDIELIRGIPTTKPLEHYDKVFISCIYFQNKEKVLNYAAQFDNAVVGGSGIDYDLNLNYDIEHILPDYSLYGVPYAMGFTSRGCIRNCGFCIVPSKEGTIHNHAPITEFVTQQHKKVILLDNNFQASPCWRENLQYIIDHNLKVNFNQGLDIRIMNQEFADYLAQTKYYSWSFKTRGFHIAFDSIKTEKSFRKGIEILDNAGIRPSHIMVYVLVGYDSTFEQDMRRVKIITELGAKPYIMRYNQIKDNRELNRLARWVNRKYYEFISFEVYQG